MKKVIAILLLSTFLFHAGGFYVIFWVLRHQASIELANRLEAEKYLESETITLKIPLAIPYNGDSYDYQPVTGEIERNGEFFRLVKQKFVRDTLYVVCIRDVRQQELRMVMTDFFKVANDLPSSSPTMKLLGNSLRDFVTVKSIETFATRDSFLSLMFDTRKSRLLCTTKLVESPPPDNYLL